MTRSGYSDDCDGWELICWRGAVKSALQGARGQAFLKEMLVALDALPNKRLTCGFLEDASGDVCALGCVGRARQIDMSKIDVDDRKQVGELFGIARAMAAEIEFVNDDDFGWKKETPEERFTRVRAWVVEQIKEGPTS